MHGAAAADLGEARRHAGNKGVDLTFRAAASQRGMKLAVLAFVTTLGLGGVVHADPAPVAPAPARGQLKQLLIERFDRNHDGRLDRQERRHAIRALRRLARRMAMQERRAEGRPGGRAEGRPDMRNPDGTARRDADRDARREARRRALIQRYDRNGDG
jgi:hypothetical protein